MEHEKKDKKMSSGVKTDQFKSAVNSFANYLLNVLPAHRLKLIIARTMLNTWIQTSPDQAANVVVSRLLPFNEFLKDDALPSTGSANQIVQKVSSILPPLKPIIKDLTVDQVNESVNQIRLIYHSAEKIAKLDGVPLSQQSQKRSRHEEKKEEPIVADDDRDSCPKHSKTDTQEEKRSLCNSGSETGSH